MLARRLTTLLPEMRVAEALDTTRMHSVAGRTDGRMALVITRPCRGGLCDSIAMGTGHSRDGYAVRERHPIKIMSRTRLICLSWWRWRGGWNQTGHDEMR